MFEELKTLINHENIQKAKANQRYLNNESSLDEREDNSSDFSLDNELSDRLYAFNLLTQTHT
jgi:hypothetical protein